MPDQPYVAHVVSHTHWDREWYRTFQIFRMRLISLTDDLLDLLDRDPEYCSFYWDGQTVVIDDYLEIRPESADRLRRAFASGRLITGPWFVQPDEFLVSGESFIRNLQLGTRTCREWGTGASVGYAPDAFGHTSQMPQILQGFGIDNAVLFRGITTDQVDAEFRWQAPDGTSVLCVKMPDDNAYSNFFYRMRDTLAATDTDQPLDEEQVVSEATALLEDSIRERPTTRNLLWMDGVDHIFPQPRTPEILRIVNRRMGDRVQVRHTTLPDFLADLRASAPNLQTVVGELRHSNRAWKLQALLTHVASSRIHTKQWNHECETLLERYAEPLCAFAWKLGADYPEGFLRYAWRQLLLNQPHDSICGCSIDQVHRDMQPRYEQCRQVGRKLAEDALAHIANRMDTSAGPKNAVAALVAFNPLSHDREHEAVDTIVALSPEGAPGTITLVDAAGAPVPATVEPLPDAWGLRQAPHDIPVGDTHRRWRVHFEGGAPGIGCRVYFIVPGPATSPTAVRAGDSYLENEHLRIDVGSDGSFTLTDHATGTARSGMLRFEDGGDIGDGYNYHAPQDDHVLTTHETAVVGKPVVDATGGRITIEHEWAVPASRAGDGRSTQTALVSIRATLRLDNASRQVDIHLNVRNKAADHRLRVLFPSDEHSADAYAVEQAFDVVERAVAIPKCNSWREPQPATGPQKTFVDVSSPERGLCVINRGLPEAEVINDAARTVAVTLLRCTGSGVGGADQQTDGQMIGEWTFDLALFPHAGNWQAAQVWREAHAFNAPIVTAVTALHEGALPAEARLAEIGPDAAVLSCIKRAEDGSGLVLRATNYGDTPASMYFGLAAPVKRVSLARMDETRLRDLPVGPKGAEVKAPARRIVTTIIE